MGKACRTGQVGALSPQRGLLVNVTCDLLFTIAITATTFRLVRDLWRLDML